MRRVLWCLTVVAAIAGPLALHPRSAATGSIRGRVEARSERGPRDTRPDPGGLGMTGSREVAELRRSVVYIAEGVRIGAFESNEQARARMDQRNEQFVPHVLAITTGTWVDFPNDDRTYHNVFSLSKSNPFNLGRYAAGRSQARRFLSPGVVRVFCEIHSHMSAFIVVFSHRYFAVTDDEGRYRIDNVPPGLYTVAAWTETLRGDPPSKQITIPDAGGQVDVDFKVQ
jgi:plastocyanin